MEINKRIDELLGQLKPITLEQMSSIRLMNRTDTKFVTSKENLVRLLEMVQGEYYAQSIDGNKIANYLTTYWDTDGHHFYLEHHNGRAPRQKVRVRTYLDSDITFLEVKTKNNHGRTKKKRIEVPSQELAHNEENEDFLKKLVHRGLGSIHPTVQNRFHRITLVNYGKTERLTIDFDVQFQNFEASEPMWGRWSSSSSSATAMCTAPSCRCCAPCASRHRASASTVSGAASPTRASNRTSSSPDW